MSSFSGGHKGVRRNKGATNQAVPRPLRPLSPANFPLGSLQSRAAARAMLAAFSKPLSQLDRDSLTIYHNAILVNYGHEPDSTTLQATTAYKRGAELYRQSHGGRELWERDGETNRAELYFKVCRRNFEVIRRREPIPGDVLTFEQFSEAEQAVRLSRSASSKGLGKKQSRNCRSRSRSTVARFSGVSNPTSGPSLRECTARTKEERGRRTTLTLTLLGLLSKSPSPDKGITRRSIAPVERNSRRLFSVAIACR
jgi:hypothetical protein